MGSQAYKLYVTFHIFIFIYLFIFCKVNLVSMLISSPFKILDKYDVIKMSDVYRK